MLGHAGPSGADGPHVFVDDLDLPELAADDHHHLARVLRLRSGDHLTVSDGRGRWRRCRFGSAIEPVGEVITVQAPDPTITVAFAVLKGGRPELVVQKLTELGIDAILPIRTERTVVRWNDEQVARAHERHIRIAREAAMQSRRVWLPTVERLCGLDAACAAHPAAAFAHREGDSPSLDHTTVVIGPEGGFTAGELAHRPLVALGDLVLRAETAAVAAGALLTALRAGLVPSDP